MNDRVEVLNTGLTKAATRHLGKTIVIEGLQPLSGGASAETWQFNMMENGKKQELILRLAPPGNKQDPIRLDRTTEAHLQKVVFESGVLVAPVSFILDEDDGLGPGYIMKRIEGETLARKILKNDEFSQARGCMTEQCGQILAGIHAVELSDLPSLRELPAEKMLKMMYTLYSDFKQTYPVFELGFRWLKDNIPEKSNFGLVHGDFRNGNFIVDRKGIRAVLDWEVAHLGDPMEDLGWICVNSWRFGNIDQPVGGFGQREELFAAYEAAGGDPVDPSIVHFWEVFGTLKWGFFCILQGFTHLLGAKRSVELAAIGRRPSETELDLLNLLT